jgi:Calcineurin-like phosphoesterase superfamily domain
VKLGLVTDLHVAPLPHAPARWHNDYDFDGACRRVESALSALAGEGVDAVAVLGDLTNAGDDDSLDTVIGILSASGLRTLVVPGNHDCEVAADALTRAVARTDGSVQTLGRAPQQIAGLAVAGVSLSRPPAGRGFGAAALPELDGQAALVLSHFPVLSRRERVKEAGYKYAGDLVGLEELTGHIASEPAPVIAVSGHLHVRDAVVRGSVLQILVPAMIEPPYECAVLEVGGDPLAVTYRAIAVEPTPPELEVPLLMPADGRWALGASGWE